MQEGHEIKLREFIYCHDREDDNVFLILNPKMLNGSPKSDM